MAKISDVVKLKSGYADFVELKSAFEAAQENTPTAWPCIVRPRPTAWRLNVFVEGFISPMIRSSIC